MATGWIEYHSTDRCQTRWKNNILSNEVIEEILAYNKKLSEEINMCHEKIDRLNKKIDVLTDQVSELTLKNEQLEKENKQLKEKNKQLEQKVQQLTLEKALISENYHALRKKVFGKSSELCL